MATASPKALWQGGGPRRRPALSGAGGAARIRGTGGRNTCGGPTSLWTSPHPHAHMRVPWDAQIGGSLIERLGPQLIIGKPVSADYVQTGEFSVQTLQFALRRGLHVQHEYVGATAVDRGTYFVAIARQVDGREILREAGRQSLGGFSIILKKDYVDWLHTSPLLHRDKRRPWLRQQNCHHRRGQIRARKSVTCATPFRPGVRTVRFGACRSASTKFQPCLRRPPIVSGRKPTVACLLQIASTTFPVEPPLFRVPGQSSRDARGIPQTLPKPFGPIPLLECRILF